MFQYVLRLAAFVPLWNIGEVAGLAWAQVMRSWPLVAAVVAVSAVMLWRSLPPGHPGLRHPVFDGTGHRAVTFTPDVAAVLRHTNTDHADDCVVICRGLGSSRHDPRCHVRCGR